MKIIIILFLFLVNTYVQAQDYIQKDTSYTTIPNRIELRTYYANLEDAEGDCGNEGKHLRIRGLKDGGYAEFTVPDAGSVTIAIKGKSTGADRIVNIFRNGLLIESFSGLDANNCATFYEETYRDESVIYRVEGGDSESTKPVVITSIQVDKYSAETTDNEMVNVLNHVDIYPTATNSYVHVRVNQETDFIKVQVFDLSGRLVISKSTIGSQEMQLNMSTVSKGLYILNVTYRNGNIQQKVIRK